MVADGGSGNDGSLKVVDTTRAKCAQATRYHCECVLKHFSCSCFDVYAFALLL